MTSPAKSRRGVVLLAVVLAIVGWTADAIFDAMLFYDEPFLDLLILRVPTNEWYMRGIMTATLIVFGVLTSLLLRRHDRAEAALRRERDFAERLIQTARAIVLVIDMEGRIVRFNPYLERLTGHRLRDVKGQDWFDAFLPREDRDRIRALFLKNRCLVRRQGDVVAITTKSGDAREIEWHDTLLTNSDGETVGLLATGQDITERKHAESTLRMREDHFRRTFDESPIGAAVVTLDYRFERVNAALCRITGYAEDELTSLTVPDITHPDDRSADVEAARRLLAGEIDQYHVDKRYVRKDGEIVWVLLSVRMMHDADGNPRFFLPMMEDITDRKHAEEERNRLSTAVEQAAEAIVITDTRGVIQYVNPAFECITGYGPEAVLGQHMRVLRSDRHDAEFYKRMWEALSRGEVWSGRLHTRQRDGNVGEVEATISPIRDRQGNITNYVAVKRDITHEVALETKLRQAQKMEAVGTLASGVAHDFNNLLTAIFGYTDHAKNTLPDGHDALQSLEMVEQAARQASGVTKSLLTFSRRVVSTKSPVLLRSIVAESMRMLRRLLPAPIEVVNDLPVDDKLWVNADATQIQQILLNLAVNGRDAMPNGGQFRVSLRRKESDDGSQGDQADQATAELVVEDTGVGMTEQTRSRIFEPFFTTRPREQGTGLGLAIIHGIVTDHGGRIELESHVGVGTRVVISLPCCAAPAEASTEPDELRRARGSGEVIVLVEDDQHIRSIMTSALRAQGYGVVQACDGIEAMTALDAHEDVRLLILDLDLPRKSGLSCLREMQERGRSVPILLITGGVELEDLARTERGDLRMMRKPFRMAELVSRVADSLSEHADEEIPA